MAKKQYEKLLMVFTVLDRQDVIASSTDPGRDDIGDWFGFSSKGGFGNE